MKYIFYNARINIFQYEAKWRTTEINTIRSVLKVLNLRNCGLSIKLSNNKDVKKINLKWKGINKPTNVLSFPNLDNKNKNLCVSTRSYLGDIILAYETLISETKIQKVNFQNHLSHILIHGVLHLKGFTHYRTEDTKVMQNEEKRLLKNLNIINPYKT